MSDKVKDLQEQITCLTSSCNSYRFENNKLKGIIKLYENYISMISEERS